MIHFAYPNVKETEYIGCGRYIGLSKKDALERGYREAEPKTPNIHKIRTAVSLIAPESFDSEQIIYEKKDRTSELYAGGSQDLAYLLALVSTSRSISVRLTGDIWCTGHVTDGRNVFLDPVDDNVFDVRLRAFLSDDNKDGLFIVPASNFLGQHKERCNDRNVSALTLKDFGLVEKLSEKTVVKIHGNELSVLVETLFKEIEQETQETSGSVVVTGNNDATSEDVRILHEQLEEMKTSNRRLQSELDELKRKCQVIELTGYRSCFFAYPFQPSFHALRNEITRILASDHGIRLMTTAIEMRGPNIVEDIKGQIAASHFGIADITGSNPNVLWELGLMNGYGKPVIIIKEKSDTVDTPYDLMGNYRVEYQAAYDDTTGSTEYALLKNGLRRNLDYIFRNFSELEQAAKWSE